MALISGRLISFEWSKEKLSYQSYITVLGNNSRILDLVNWSQWCSGYKSLNKLHYKLTRRLEYIRVDIIHVTLEYLDISLSRDCRWSCDGSCDGSDDIITWYFVNETISNFILLVKSFTSDWLYIFTYKTAALRNNDQPCDNHVTQILSYNISKM